MLGDDDLRLLNCIVGRSVPFGRGEETDVVIGAIDVAHERVEPPRGRRRPKSAELGRHDDEEAPPSTGTNNPASVLQPAQGGTDPLWGQRDRAAQLLRVERIASFGLRGVDEALNLSVPVDLPLLIYRTIRISCKNTTRCAYGAILGRLVGGHGGKTQNGQAPRLAPAHGPRLRRAPACSPPQAST